MDPNLIVIFGLPGSGKSTFARALSAHLGMPHLSTDVIRSELGKRMQYDKEDKEFIYDQMLERATAEVEKGQGVILDGTFHQEASRVPFRNLARQYGIPVKWVEVTAKEAVIRDRVSGQRAYSEADFGVYQKIRRDFEPITEKVLVLHSDTEDLTTLIGKTLEFLNT